MNYKLETYVGSMHNIENIQRMKLYHTRIDTKKEIDDQLEKDISKSLLTQPRVQKRPEPITFVQHRYPTRKITKIPQKSPTITPEMAIDQP